MRNKIQTLCFTIFCASLYFSALSAYAGINVGTLSVEQELRPGDSSHGTISLSNGGSLVQAVSVYQTDYLFFSDGSNRYDEAGQIERSNAKWITFRPHRADIPAGQTIEIAYEIEVPDDSTLVGTYWSMIMVEEVASTAAARRILKENETQIQQVLRYGVQCVTDIKDTDHHQLGFTGSQLVAIEDNRTELWIDVENSGDRWTIPSASMELYDAAGKHVGLFDGESRRIYPGTSVRFRIDLGNNLGGKYKALIILDSGGQEVLGTRLDLEF